MKQKREHKETKTQEHKYGNNTGYRTTIPRWIADKVLQIKKGDKLSWDFKGNTATIQKKE